MSGDNKKESIGQELNDVHTDAIFHLRDGRTYPIFSCQESEKDEIHCNICDTLMPNNKEEVAKHSKSFGHEYRLSDDLVEHSTQNVLEYARKFGVMAIQQNESKAEEYVEEDAEEVPPGCEDLLSGNRYEQQLSSCLKEFDKSALIGVEFVLEVNQDAELQCVQHSFFMCLLCDKRCNNLDNIIIHLQSAAHRLLYLSKYFPKAYSLFRQVDPHSENFSSDIHDFLEAVVKRIESVLGRLEVFSCSRCQWELKSQYYRSKIEHGTHLKETEALQYNDIKSPFVANVEVIDQVGLPGINTPLSCETLSNTDDPSGSNSSMENETNFANIIGRNHNIISCDRYSVTNRSENLTFSEIQTQVAQPNQSKESSKTDILYSSSLDKESRELNNVETARTAKEDDEVIVEKEVVVNMKSTITSKSRKRSSRSRAPKRMRRSQSRSRSRSPSRVRSWSRSPRRRFRSDSPEYKSTYYEKPHSYRSYYQHDDRSRYTWVSSHYKRPVQTFENQRGVKNVFNPNFRQSPTPEEKKEIEKNNLRRKMKKEVEEVKLKLFQERKHYQMYPEKHPLYREEWNTYWRKRFKELKSEGKNPDKHNFKPEWLMYWNNRVKKLEKEELKAKKIELKRKYDFSDQEPQVSSTVNKEPEGAADNRKPVQFGWNSKKKTPLFDLKSVAKEIEASSSFKSSSSETPKVPDKPKFIPVSNTIFSPSSAERERSSDPDLLRVVRTLAAFEDKLGSYGPKITKLLSRVLAAERHTSGSSSRLLQDDPECIDLLDTSKEKLIGAMSIGTFNDPEQTKAATQAVENVARLIDKARPSTSGLTVSSITSTTPFDLDTFVKNLQNVGFTAKLTSAHQPKSSTMGLNGSHARPDTTFQDIQTHIQQIYPKQFLNKNDFRLLIENFQTLNTSQQLDLINLMRDKEEKYQRKNPTISNHHRSRPLSPLSKKCYQSEMATNPSAPIPRYPALMEITGFSEEDLKKFGIPLHEIDVSNSNQRVDPPCTIPVYDVEPIEENPRRVIRTDPRLNSATYYVPNKVPHRNQQFSFSADHQQIGWKSANATSMHIAQENSKMSFYNEQLDPRRNKALYPDKPDKAQAPIFLFFPVCIPTSPILPFHSQESNKK